MPSSNASLSQRIDAQKPLLLAEMSPPQGCDAGPVREVARHCRGKVHALGISDNRDRVTMSPLAAASLVMAEGVEPILHLVTRDKNRIALVSDSLGAQALGIRNLFCTSGTHQTLGSYRAAKNVFDVDPVQLLQLFSGLPSDASLLGEASIGLTSPFCLGAVATPYADPLELQVLRLAKKVQAGAKFLVTQPVFDVERFTDWWQEITRHGLHEKTAIVAGIQPLCSSEQASAHAARRPAPRIPDALIRRLASHSGAAAQRAAGVEIALETIHRLAAIGGLRGFQVCGDGDMTAALEVIDQSGLGTN